MRTPSPFVTLTAIAATLLLSACNQSIEGTIQIKGTSSIPVIDTKSGEIVNFVAGKAKIKLGSGTLELKSKNGEKAKIRFTKDYFKGKDISSLAISGSEIGQIVDINSSVVGTVLTTEDRDEWQSCGGGDSSREVINTYRITTSQVEIRFSPAQEPTQILGSFNTSVQESELIGSRIPPTSRCTPDSPTEAPDTYIHP